jgi:hypothetical protein
VTASGRYPLVARAMLDTEEQPDHYRAFERRLAYILDGLAMTFTSSDPG